MAVLVASQGAGSIEDRGQDLLGRAWTELQAQAQGSGVSVQGSIEAVGLQDLGRLGQFLSDHGSCLVWSQFYGLR
jgi:hypothetical protein